MNRALRPTFAGRPFERILMPGGVARALAALLAAATHAWIELRGIALGRRLIPWRKARGSER
jgi:hypothetical protein